MYLINYLSTYMYSKLIIRFAHRVSSCDLRLGISIIDPIPKPLLREISIP